MVSKIKSPRQLQADKNPHVPTPNLPQIKFHQAKQALMASLVERESEIDMVLTALIARENPLLIGPPGVAKSLLLDSLSRWVDTVPFDYLLTRFTDPMELFGPIDLNALKAGENRRNVEGYLPTAAFAFLDEIWKGSSAILNTLIKVLNERTFKYGKQLITCPLILCVAASNEWPVGDDYKDLGALFDRFLFRKEVKSIDLCSKAGRGLLERADQGDLFQAQFKETITPGELLLAHQQAMSLPISHQAQEARHQILQTLKENGVLVGNRRGVKAIKAIKASAYLSGASEVLPEHLEILSHVLWEDPTEQPVKCEKIVIKIANSIGYKALAFQGQSEDVQSQAEEQLKGFTNERDRIGLIEGTLRKLQDLEQELKDLGSNARRDRALECVGEAIKTWQYRRIGANRE